MKLTEEKGIRIVTEELKRQRLKKQNKAVAVFGYSVASALVAIVIGFLWTLIERTTSY